MIAESGTATYSDDLLGSVIIRYPLADAAGEWPLLTSGSANTDWVATYDLANAAADVWSEKATNLVDNFDFTADGATFNKEQQLRNYERQVRQWRSRRAPGTHELRQYPAPRVLDEWIGNLPEDD